MRIVIAEDDRPTARLLAGLARSWGYEVDAHTGGHDALAALEASATPELAILDWMLPEMDGPEICRRVRAGDSARSVRTYIVLLTSRTEHADVIAGLEAGADDYLRKPFDAGELAARLQVGARMVTLQHTLATSVRELELALANVRKLSGLLPICAYCHSIRDDSDYWHRVDEYLSNHAEVRFSHSICPKCLARVEKESGLA
jgi:DNA-binding response OmpR family regulator